MQIQPSIWPSEALSGTPLWVEGQDVCSDFDQFFLHMKWWNDKMYAAGICVESGFMHGGADAAAGWWFWWWWWWCLVVFSVHFKKSSSHGDGPNWNAESQAAPHPTDIAVAGLATPTPNCYTAVGASKYIAPVEVELLQGFLGNRLARTILRGGHIDLYLTATVVAWQPRKRPPAAV